MSRNKQSRPYALPLYLKEMQAACDVRKNEAEGYEAARAAGNLHHEISTKWSDTERSLGLLELSSSADANEFLRDIEAAYAEAMTDYLDQHIEKMNTIATGSVAEIVRGDVGTSYLSERYLLAPAFDNANTPYDDENEEYYSDEDAKEEQAKLRRVAGDHRDFLLQFKETFAHVLTPGRTVEPTSAPTI